jgi:tRNA wybutosine-synthesizing protein 4
MEEAFKINRKNKKIRNDNAVQGTNDSSVLSKISICQLGYFDDDYLKHFGVKIVRRSPLINR